MPELHPARQQRVQHVGAVCLLDARGVLNPPASNKLLQSLG